jgi:hypothetical protein
VFSGSFPAYDWIKLGWLFGGMNDPPFAFHQLCLDINRARRPSYRAKWTPPTAANRMQTTLAPCKNAARITELV